MVHRITCVVLVVAVAAGPPLPAQPPALPPKEVTVRTNVKAATKFATYDASYHGVVDKLTAQTLTVRVDGLPGRPPLTREVFPIDRLADGKLADGAGGAFAYRWQDVQKGDRVVLHVVRDGGEGKLYCYELCIDRRPGGKLPESQDPKGDGRHFRESLLNDIDNGEDVSDADVAAAYPPLVVPKSVPGPGPAFVVTPRSLPEEYQRKLDAIRAKKAKEQEPKAAPPGKK